MDDLSDAERRLIHLIRLLGFGQVTITIHNGQPTTWQSAVTGNRLDKPSWPGQLEFLQEASQHTP